MRISNIKNVSGLIIFISENTAWSPVTVANVVCTLGYRKNGGLESLKQLSGNLADCAKYGADCGIRGFTMYHETLKFFRENRRDIIRNLESGAEQNGVSVFRYVKSFSVYRRGQAPSREEISRAVFDAKIHDDLTDLFAVGSAPPPLCGG
jgi:hypothetical protein